MNKFERFVAIHNMLKGRRRVVSKQVLSEELECSAGSVERLIESFKNTLGAPIIYDRELKGYKYDPEGEALFEIPGLWLTGAELQTLMLFMHLLESLGTGLLSEGMVPIDKRLTTELEKRGISRAQLTSHIRILPLANHLLDDTLLLKVSRALVERKRLRLNYQDYQSKKSTRVVSPQRMAWYRDCWYLDAYCHKRQEIRTFALSRIEKAQVLDEKAEDCEDTALDEELASGYGIFGGKAKHEARLIFLPPVARDVSMRRWHPREKGHWQGKEYHLSFPYSDDRELVKDILAHVPWVRVEEPKELREKVRDRLIDGVEMFG